MPRNPAESPERQAATEELRWRRKAFDPEKTGRNRRRLYWLLAVWSVAAIGWTILIILKFTSFNWAGAIVLAIGYINLALGIANCKRAISGKKPL